MAEDREEVINAQLAEIQQSISKLRSEQKTLARELEEIETKRAAAKKVAGMGQAEREAIVQMIAEAGSIESQESVKGLAS